MKYSEMDKDQKEAIRERLTLALRAKVTEEKKYSDQVLRFLNLGNGAGILLLMAFMGALAGNDKDFSMIMIPLGMFFFGLLSAALVFVPLVIIANKATVKFSNKIEEFFLDQNDTCNLTDYRMKTFARIVIMGLFIFSAIMFFCGVCLSFIILKQI
ncbi:MAG: hypothetical protein GY797_02680 [Deltaproteobacteria bacterium]|nr:hypothetical protein [Deltaproteobacteria bacterium]